MTDQERQAFEQGHSTKPKAKNAKLATRSAEDVQIATRDQIESLSEFTSEQMYDATITRSAEKLAFKVLQNADGVVEKASEHLASFLPQMLNPDSLMAESELDQFMKLTAA